MGMVCVKCSAVGLKLLESFSQSLNAQKPTLATATSLCLGIQQLLSLELLLIYWPELWGTPDAVMKWFVWGWGVCWTFLLLQKMVTSNGSGSLTYNFLISNSVQEGILRMFFFCSSTAFYYNRRMWNNEWNTAANKCKLQCKLAVLFEAYDQICSSFLYRNKASQYSTVSPLSFLLCLVLLRHVFGQQHLFYGSFFVFQVSGLPPHLQSDL